MKLVLLIFIFTTCFSDSVLALEKPEIGRQDYTSSFFSFFGSTNDCPLPPEFPKSIPIKKENLKEFSPTLNTPWLWKAVPKSPKQIILLTKWAYIYEYSLRPMGRSKTLNTFSIPRDVNCSRVVLIDTAKSLNQIKIINDNLVSVQTGVRIMDLLEFLDKNNAGISVVPVDSENTVGESVALGDYGTGVNSIKEKAMPFGSLSSLVMSFKAIVWDKDLGYVSKRFDRNDPRTVGFLTHLGRAFLTDVTLLIEPRYQLRCQTFTDFPSENIFSNPSLKSQLPDNSFSNLVDEYGKVEVSYFPNVDRSWVKLWSRETHKPLGSLLVDRPDAPILARSVPRSITSLASTLTSYFPLLSPSVSRMMFDLGGLLMRLSGASDIWGPSQNTMYLFSNESVNHKQKSAYAVLTPRSNVQYVVYDFYKHFSTLVKQFRADGKYPLPVNSALKIRVSGLDSFIFDPENEPNSRDEHQHDIKMNLFPPALSILSEVKSHPEFDIAVIFEMHYIPEVVGSEQFANQMESWIFSNYQNQEKTIVRPTWGTASTGRTNNSPFGNKPDVLKNSVTPSYGPDWNVAIKVLEYYDPHKIFSNSFLDTLLSYNSENQSEEVAT